MDWSMVKEIKYNEVFIRITKIWCGSYLQTWTRWWISLDDNHYTTRANIYLSIYLCVRERVCETFRPVKYLSMCVWERESVCVCVCVWEREREIQTCRFLIGLVGREFANGPCSFSLYFVRVQMVRSYSSTDTAITWEKSVFILSERSDFYMIDNLSIAVHAFARCMVTSLLVDEMLPAMYENWSKSTNFKSFPH